MVAIAKASTSVTLVQSINMTDFRLFSNKIRPKRIADTNGFKGVIQENYIRKFACCPNLALRTVNPMTLIQD